MPFFLYPLFRKITLFFCFCLFISTSSITFAQNADDALRLYDNNTIGWFQTSATARLTDKWGVVGEYNWRRTNLVNNWLQGQIQQQSGTFSGKSVIQLNEGLMVNCILNFDLRKPKEEVKK